MKIVALDGNAVNSGDLSWKDIAELGDFEVYPRTASCDVISRAQNAEIILTNKVVLDATTLAMLPKLRYIGLLSTGYNVVDLPYCKSHCIPVCNIPSYSTYSVAQMTMALVLEIAIGAQKHSESVKAGNWSKCPDFCYCEQNIIELFGKTFGIVGYGQIGRQVAQVALALGMRVLAYSRHTVESDNSCVTICSLEQLFAQSDIISLHCPLNAQSEKMLNASTLKLVKDGAIVINTARGGLVDEDAVAAALTSGKLLAYGADVLTQEPPSADNKLIACPNAIITPHIAWASRSARSRLLEIARQNIIGFLNGKIQNCVY